MLVTTGIVAPFTFSNSTVWLDAFCTALVTAASSDAPVIDPDPFAGIYAAVTRRARSGRVVGASEAVSAGEALRMYTIQGAYAGGQERETGSIKVGKRADLALLDRDPVDVEPEDVLGTKVALTLIGGMVAWDANGLCS